MYSNQQSYQQPQQQPNQQQGKKQRSDFVQACYQHKFYLKGRLARAHVLSTYDYQNKGNPKHSTYLIVDPNDPKVIELQNVIANLKNQFYPHVPDLLWVNPIKDGRTPTKPNGDQWQEWQKGLVFLGCSTSVKSPPGAHVMDANSPNGKGTREANIMDEKNYFYDGADAIIEVALGGMEGKDKGVNLYFNGIIGYGTGERMVIASGGNSFNVEEAFNAFMGSTAGQRIDQASQHYNQVQQNHPYENNGQPQQPQQPQQQNVGGYAPQQNNGYAPQPQQNYGQPQQPQQPQQNYGQPQQPAHPSNNNGNYNGGSLV